MTHYFWRHSLDAWPGKRVISTQHRKMQNLLMQQYLLGMADASSTAGGTLSSSL